MTALSSEQIAGLLDTLPGWSHLDGSIRRQFAFPTYLAGVAFASAVGVVCEGLEHHPEMVIGYKKVSVTFTTHDAGSQVTDRDIAAAEAVERLGYPRA